MTDQEIREKIFGVLGRVAPEADFGKLPPEENLREALDIDSFDFLNVIIAISREFGIEVPESDYGNIATLDNMVRYISARHSV